MRYLCLAVAIVVMSVNLCFADNIERVKELGEENQILSGQIQQAQNFIQQAQVKLIGNNAVIEELKRQDKKEAEVKPEVPKE